MSICTKGKETALRLECDIRHMPKKGINTLVQHSRAVIAKRECLRRDCADDARSYALRVTLALANRSGFATHYLAWYTLCASWHCWFLGCVKSRCLPEDDINLSSAHLSISSVFAQR